KYDYTFDYRQIEKTRKLLMSGKPGEGQRIAFEDVKVEVKKDKAELRCRATQFFGADSVTVEEIYSLRKTVGGWKVYRNRGWPVENRLGGKITRFDEKTWRQLDDDVINQVDDPRGDKVGLALMAASRFAEAHAMFKKVCDRKDAGADDWARRGDAAMAAGD